MNDWTDAMNDWIDDNLDRRGRCLIVWTRDEPPTPVDRYDRDVGQIRAHLERVAGVVELLRQVVELCEGLDLGREAGKHFWRRFEVQLEVLDRVVKRDNYYVASLEEAALAELEGRPADV